MRSKARAAPAGFVRGDDHGRCPSCLEPLPRHDPDCDWQEKNPNNLCTNPMHVVYCPLVAERLSKYVVDKTVDLRMMERFRWRYLYDEWTFLLFPREPTVGMKIDRCAPCAHPQGEVVAKRQVGCIVVRCLTCGWEGVYHLPGCGKICASSTPFSSMGGS
jgi:hypothetical protein